ncbi:MAG: tyrosine-type recombinase/integrase [Armatimonadota bacterium]
MLFLDALEDYLRHISLEKHYSPRTVGTYKWWSHHYGRFLLENGYDAPLTVLDAFNTPVLRRFQQSLSERKLKGRTILAAFFGLRGLGDFLVEQKVLPANPVRDLTMPKKGAAERKVVSDEELKRLLLAVGLQRDQERIAYERALLSTLIYTGVRAQELLDMRLPNINFDAKTLLVPHGKGDKSRLLYPPNEWWSAMREWVAQRPKCNHDWIWVCDVRRRISVETMRRELEEIKARAGLSYANHIKPHSIRHALATRMMVQGATIRSIQASLGHSDAQTTLHYLHHKEQAAQDMRTAASFSPSPEQTTPLPTKTSRAETISRMRRRSAGGSK